MIRTALLTLLLMASTSGSAQSGPDGLCRASQTQGCPAIRAREIVDVTQAPWRGIGRVNFASIQIRSHCTGTLVGDNIVLTAAHCLYNSARKSWIPAQSITFVAGYQRGEHIAASPVARYILDDRQDPTSNSFHSNPSSDWALLLLETPIGAQVGALATGHPNMDETPVLIGYPAIRPHVASIARDCGPIRQDASATILRNTCAAMNGDSGAPLLSMATGTPRIIGVLSAVTAGSNGLQTISVAARQWEPALHRLQNNASQP